MVSMKNFHLYSILGAVVAFSAPAATPAHWSTDLPEALAQAKMESKLVLVEFTGSDWCTGCIQLRRTVLDSAEFLRYAEDKFVPVQVDLPLRVKSNHALYARNKEIAEFYKVGGYPTILVLTDDGKVAGGFEGVLSMNEVRVHLEHACVAANLLQQAARQTGTARARTLLQVYRNFPKSKSFSAHTEQLRASILEAAPSFEGELLK